MDAAVVGVTDVEAAQAIKDMQDAAAAASRRSPSPAAAAADVPARRDDAVAAAAVEEVDLESDVEEDDFIKVDGPAEPAAAADRQDDGADIYIYIYI